MTTVFPQLGLVPPYAFNYHRNKTDHTFHGLAFANFNAPHEARAAVDALNNFQLDGRPLWVELKKRLPAEEEQRKRQAKRLNGQLWHENSFLTTLEGGARHRMGMEEQREGVEAIAIANDILDPAIRPQIVSLVPVATTPPIGTSYPHLDVLLMKDLDLNEPETQGFYTTMMSFLYNPETKGMALLFPTTLTPTQRDKVRCIAVKLKLHRLCDPEEGSIAVTHPPTSQGQSNPHLFAPSSIPEFGYYRPFPTTPSASPEDLVSSRHDPHSLPYDAFDQSLSETL